MTDSQHLAARLLVLGFRPDTDGAAQARRLIAAGAGGIVLFARNVPEDPAQIRQTCHDLKTLRPDGSLLLCVDQEGGRVARLRGPFTAVPSARTIGATGDEAVATAAGEVLGAELRWAGFDVNFAPVVDVDSNPANPVIADRSYGASPALVSRLGPAVVRGIQSRGVAACAKHFPGHGDTSTDSHHALPRLDHALDRLEAVELPPFKACIDAGVAGVMSAHVIFSPIDPNYPATMSRPALGALLRDRWAFDGVVFSDDLEMKAVADHYALEDQLLRGHEAGIDLFLICHSPDLQWKAIDLLARAIDRGTLPRARLDASLRRISSLVREYCRPAGPGSLADVQARHAPQRDLLRRLGVQSAASDPTAYR